MMNYLHLQGVDGTMTLLQVENRVEARDMIEQIDVDVRVFPSFMLLYISLKGIIGVVVDVFAVFFIVISGWDVVDGNKHWKNSDDTEPIIAKEDERTTL